MARTKKPTVPHCRWAPDDDGIYQTDCGQSFCFIDDGPVENKMQFCCYCGAALRAESVRLSSAMRRAGTPTEGT